VRLLAPLAIIQPRVQSTQLARFDALFSVEGAVLFVLATFSVGSPRLAQAGEQSLVRLLSARKLLPHDAHSRRPMDSLAELAALGH
jgi:hypothetical protein